MKKLSYNKLFKLLIDQNMSYKDLMDEAHVSKSSFYKIKQGKNVTTDILLRICVVLDCDISDIMECVDNNDRKI